MNTLGTNARCAALLLALLLLAGCNAVLVKEPMGDTVVMLDPATWQGTWASSDVVILTTVLDSEKGLLQAAWVERGAEGEGASFESVSGMVRQTGDVIFLSMENEPEAELGTTADPAAGASAEQVPTTPAPATDAALAPEYIWGRIENDGKRMILWWPDVEQFQRAVQDGRLPGTVTESEDVVLGPLDSAQLERINSPAGNLLGWSEPAVFIRIGD
jgi:hypothetical protein